MRKFSYDRENIYGQKNLANQLFFNDRISQIITDKDNINPFKVENEIE